MKFQMCSLRSGLLHLALLLIAIKLPLSIEAKLHAIKAHVICLNMLISFFVK